MVVQNRSCGPSRRWNGKRWVNIDAKERKCSDKYNGYPFVFLKDDGKDNGVEQLRQGSTSTVIHEVACVSVNSGANFSPVSPWLIKWSQAANFCLVGRTFLLPWAVYIA